DAKARYFMTYLGEDQDHHFLRIQPRDQIDREAFIRADVALSKETFMPNWISLLAPNEKDRQTFDFRGAGAWIRPNAPVEESNFKGVVLEGWDVVRNPGPDGKPQNAVGARPRQAPAQQGAVGRRR
ncbi:MAG TPA: hypothetical protein VGY53_03285, partial [Isosphaeraceae bacterium]|nr:hypothetical protein [Isosphaeraceae bacterium]